MAGIMSDEMSKPDDITLMAYADGELDAAEKKMVDLNTTDIEQAAKMIAGSARSMGIEVEGG